MPAPCRAPPGARRIDDEHRLVYLVEGDRIVVLQARHLYDVRI
jgi:hypothetical protein